MGKEAVEKAMLDALIAFTDERPDDVPGGIAVALDAALAAGCLLPPGPDASAALVIAALLRREFPDLPVAAAHTADLIVDALAAAGCLLPETLEQVGWAEADNTEPSSHLFAYAFCDKRVPPSDDFLPVFILRGANDA